MSNSRLDELAEFADDPHSIIREMTMKELWNLQIASTIVNEDLWNHAAACAECSIKMHKARAEELESCPQGDRVAALAFAKRLVDRHTAAAAPSESTSFNESGRAIRPRHDSLAYSSVPEVVCEAGSWLRDVVPEFQIGRAHV